MTTQFAERDLALVTVAEAAAVAEVSQATIRKWAARYRLPCVLDDRGRMLLSEQAVIDCERARRHDGRGRRRLVA